MCKHSNSRCIDSRGQATAGHAPKPVTVDWATADGTAEAGADYEAARDTLSFAAGETGKTVEVASIDDHEHEESETLTLTLSNARGARIAVGRATGRITNTDVIPGAWLARFGCRRTRASPRPGSPRGRIGVRSSGVRIGAA